MRRLLLCLLTLGLLAPAGAAADTYCVGVPNCAGTAVADLDAAAKAVTQRKGPDRVEIGAGTFAAPLAGFGPASEPVEVVGAGRDATVLEAVDGRKVSLVGGSSRASDLAVRVVGANRNGVTLSDGATLERAAVGGEDPQGTGVSVIGGGTVSDVVVRMNQDATPVNYGIYVGEPFGAKEPAGPALLDRVDVTGGYGVWANEHRAPVGITRSRIESAIYGVYVTAPSPVAIEETFVRSATSALAVRDERNQGATPVFLRHASLIGVKDHALDAGSATDEPITITARDTLFNGGTYDLYPRSSGVSLDLAYSVFNVFKFPRDPAVHPATLGEGNQNSTYGDPAVLAIDNASDAGGTDGDSDGIAQRDIGAVEAPAATVPRPVTDHPFRPGPLTPGSMVIPPLGSTITKATRKGVRGTGAVQAEVAVSVVRKARGRCKAMTAKGRFTRIPCKQRAFNLVATGTERWKLSFPKKLRKGRYTITTRARRGGLYETAFSRKAGNVRVLKVS